MNMHLSTSKKIALDFVRAERRASTFAANVSGKTRERIDEDMNKATAALQQDTLAQQLLPSAREYERLYQERKNIIASQTMLSTVSLTLDQVADGDMEIHSGQFKDTLIDDDWDQLCDALEMMDPEVARKALIAFSSLLDSLVVDLNKVDLPPVPKFAI
jgi:hypothetical protein